VHNDSGNAAVLFAMTKSGQSLGRYECLGTVCVDWEDIAIGKGSGGSWFLYIADIGDNDEKRSDVTIYRAPEPALGDQRPPAEDEAPGASAPETREQGDLHSLAGVKSFKLRYAGGKAYDAETLLVDPRDEKLYVVTKSKRGLSRLFEVPTPLLEGQLNELRETTTIQFPGSGGPERLTAGDISPDGRLLLLKTYTHAYVWLRKPKETLAQTLARPGCPAPLKLEPQGESIAFDATSRGYFTVSEGTTQPIYYFAATP
jgi:hypothetical protein